MQEIVKMTPQEKQVMMFSATLPRELRAVCKKFMQDVSHSHGLERPSFYNIIRAHFNSKRMIFPGETTFCAAEQMISY